MAEIVEAEIFNSGLFNNAIPGFLNVKRSRTKLVREYKVLDMRISVRVAESLWGGVTDC